MNDLIGAGMSARGLAATLPEVGGNVTANTSPETDLIDLEAMPAILRVQREYAPPRITVASQMIMSGP